MAFKRQLLPAGQPSHSELTQAMASIGMAFAVGPSAAANIEDTLLAASREGMDGEDFRTLAMLTNWLCVHHSYVLVERLRRVLTHEASPRVSAYWAAVGRWLGEKERRFAALRKLYRGPRIDALSLGGDFQLARHGEDERFAGGPLRVPANLLQRKEGDVEPPEMLARHHPAYRSRVMMGPSYRADLWAALSEGAALSVAELARRAYAPFATAWRAKHDWQALGDGGRD